MSDELWGSLDVDDIPEDPYFVDEGAYNATVTRAETTETRDGDAKAIIEYTLDDYEPEEDQEDYSGQSVTEWFDRYPDLTKSELAAMPGSERKEILQKMSRLRNRIGHLGFDLNDPKVAKEFEISHLMDTEVGLTIKVNSGKDGRRFSNVSYVKAQHLIDQEESLLED